MIIMPTMVRATDSVQIVTSIKPLMLVTKEITEGASLKVDYLLPSNVSEHNYALKISDIKRLHDASLVIWLGSEMEPYLESSLNNWAPSKINGSIKSLPLLESMAFEEQGHEKRVEDEHHHTRDPHIWLSPLLAQQMAKQISARLSMIYPADRPRFESNLHTFSQKLLALDKSTAASLAPYKNKPFFVYHSAYGYFVRRYGLNQIGSLHGQPGSAMTLRQLNSLQQLVDGQSQAICLFREPQFASASIPAFKGKARLKIGKLDPLGIKATSYELLIGNLAEDFLECFTQD